MRKSASEIVNDLETRVANLEKEAIFGLFRRDREEPMSLREKNLKRRQREQDEREALNRKELKRKQKHLKARVKEAQKGYEKFMDDLQYQLFNQVDDIDVDMRRGDLSGVITMGQFEYKIISELGEVKSYNDVEAEITVVGPGLRKPLTVNPVVYGIRAKYDEDVIYSEDPNVCAKRIFKALKRAAGIAHSDKAVTDRAEAKRMRKEKYRLANRR